ncbi:MAG: GNAT family N-acetyltransferase [Candidatus Dormibacteria bacterium]
MSDLVVLVEGTAEDVADLRQRVLRAHLPEERLVAPQDTLPGTVHLLARCGDRVVGVVTCFMEEAPHRRGEPALRFRGMAVDPDEQGRGTGSALVREVLDRGRRLGARLVWANGRDTALGFYSRLGFEVVGETFMDPISRLPHHLIAIRL